MGAVVYAQETQTGKLKIHVNPEEAYTFVDGEAYGPGDHTIQLNAGDHRVVIANYGFTFHTQDVSIEPNGVSHVKAELARSGEPVSGPRGRIQIETGAAFSTKAAVLLNGKTPAYFVGHVDEFNNDIIAKQELIVPPGKHLVTITHHGKEIWSGVLEVGANQRVILDASNGKQRVKQWDRGTQLGDVPRFKAGIASATVAIAPVSGTISATPEVIDCGQTARLAWKSAETIDADISGFSPVPVSGEKKVSPKQTTKYDFTATGPGGVTKSSATVQVNTMATASIEASPAEVRYRKIGDKVLEQGSTTLNWSSSNADEGYVTSLGAVETNGTQTVKPVPMQTANGPVNETLNYTFKASNGCGGWAAKTAAVHLTGSIEPVPGVVLHSVFFPTAYPMKNNPSLGLLGSQRQALMTLAAGFTKYLEYDPDAKLTLAAHTDTRGSAGMNMQLAVRRAEVVKAFLISQGIAEKKIAMSAVGEEMPLDAESVAKLESQNPQPAPATRKLNAAGMQLAYERRVDIALLPTNMESARFYPNGAPDAQILWQKAVPPKSVIEKEQ
jgi:hypothetical protein